MIRIAMWSGPRNLSTAMMRAFGNRADCRVVDEPFYAAYLAETGIDHPMRAETLATQPTDWRRVAAALAETPASGPALHYEKHMTHHMCPRFGRDWIADVVSAFLIRAPERVLASYARKREASELGDIGFVEQAALFDRVSDRLGHAPPVIDAEDVRRTPEPVLRGLCAGLGIAFDPAMLSWPAGRRASDGVWGAHWYGAVERSTGFEPPDKAPPDLPDALRRVADAARPIYDRLAAHRLTGDQA